MERSEITRKVKEVIAQNSHYTVDEIKIGDKLSKFVTEGFKDRLARRMKNAFQKINSTELTNKFYATVGTVEQLVTYIKGYYP